MCCCVKRVVVALCGLAWVFKNFVSVGMACVWFPRSFFLLILLILFKKIICGTEDRLRAPMVYIVFADEPSHSWKWFPGSVQTCGGVHMFFFFLLTALFCFLHVQYTICA